LRKRDVLTQPVLDLSGDPKPGAALELSRRVALQDPFALKLAKASVNQTMDIQGQRRALEAAFKNYMLTIPHRQALGTYGAAARAKGVKDRIKTRDGKFGDAAGG
jgi:enoyl-CoA hydratase